MTAAEFRTKTEPPTKPGWYYGRPHAFMATIGPVLVDFAPSSGKPCVFLAGQEYSSRFDQFDWFGPVAEVREG